MIIFFFNSSLEKNIKWTWSVNFTFVMILNYFIFKTITNNYPIKNYGNLIIASVIVLFKTNWIFITMDSLTIV